MSPQADSVSPQVYSRADFGAGDGLRERDVPGRFLMMIPLSHFYKNCKTVCINKNNGLILKQF